MFNNKKLNFLEQIYYAVIKPKQYYRLTKVSGGRMTGFVFLFLFITSLFSIIPMFYSMVGPNGIHQFLREELPEFEMKDGELYANERFEYKKDNIYVIIDTDVDAFTDEDIDKSYYQVLLFSRTNMINYQSFQGIQEVEFSDLSMFHFDNNILEIFIPFLYIILVVTAIFIYLIQVAVYYFTALLYSLLSLIVSSFSNARLTYATIYKTAIYGKVPAYILSTLLGATGLLLPYHLQTAIGILITCAFVVFGTISHTSDDAYEEAGINPNDMR